MNARASERWIRGALVGGLLLVGGAPGCAAATDGAADGEGRPVDPAVGEDASALLATGAVTAAVSTPCPSFVMPGASCRQLTVSCPNISPNSTAYVAVAQPSGTPKGTIVLHNGLGGQQVLDSGLPSSYLSAGFRVVQVAWPSPWESISQGSTKTAACRPSTVLNWIYANVHLSDKTKGYCGQGISGGASVMAYALAHYGLGSKLDYVSLLSGPPMGRVDYGCAPLTYSPSKKKLLCGHSLPISYESFAVSAINGWEKTSTCGGSYTSADLARWSSDSVVSPGASFSYPFTPVDLAVCVNAPMSAGTLGSFYYDQITSAKSTVCAAGTCSGENVLSDATAFAAITGNMKTKCKSTRP